MRKPLSNCTRQQQYKRVLKSLSHCKNEGFQPCLVELEEIDTGKNVAFDLAKGTFNYKSSKTSTSDKSLIH